jgi:hypothetical protein
VVLPELAPAETASSYRFGMSLAGSDGAVPGPDADRSDSDAADGGSNDGGANDAGSTSGTDDRTVPVHASCASGELCTLTVVMERTDSRTTAITNISSDLLVFYLENVELSSEDRLALSRILELKQRLARIDAEIAADRGSVDAIHRDQNRVRQNMAALDRNSSLYRRYLTDLEEQENELDELEVRLEDRNQARRALQEELDRVIGGLQSSG